MPEMQDRTQVWPLGWEYPLEEEMATCSSILAWKIYGQSNLAGYSPWGHKELDLTEETALTHADWIKFIKILKQHCFLPSQGYLIIWPLMSSWLHYWLEGYIIVLYCTTLSYIWLFVTPWTLAHQVLLSIKFSRQVYWSGLPFPTPGDFPNPQIKPLSLLSSSLAGRFFTTVPSGKPHKRVWTKVNEGLVEGAIFHELVQQSTQAHSTT